MKLSKISKKIVIKVGSSLLTGGTTFIVKDNLSRIVAHLVKFERMGFDVILVTSGAIASGLSILDYATKPKDLAELQAAAAVGQNILIQAYSSELNKFHLNCAQLLLTRDDFMAHGRYLNVRNTINALLRHKIVPIVNENDAVSTDEIRFGDNDTLSARVAAAVEADGLLILTDIDGLYDSFDGKTKKVGKLIKRIENITPEIKAVACGTDKVSCVGGMSTKIKAAIIANSADIPVVLANGLKKELNIDFSPIPGQEGDGTYFVVNSDAGRKPKLKKHWLAFEANIKGKIIVDDGARSALVLNGKSLLAPGIVSVEGDFRHSDVVDISDSKGDVFAKGKVSLSSTELGAVKGKKIEDEVVHRDNLVILG